MNYLEFKRRLMTDPRRRDRELLDARRKGAEYAEAAAESDEFEAKLERALHVSAPDKLAEDIILHQSMSATSDRRHRLPAYLAVAASLVIAVAVGWVMYTGQQPAPAPLALHEHLVWHWEMDGPAALQASRRAPSDEQHVRRIFGQMGIHLDHEFIERIRLSKFCPTPDGTGVHAVLDTDTGPVTLFYMPHTQVADALEPMELPDGMEAIVVNLERGSMALVAEAGQDKPQLVEIIRQQMHFPPGLNL